MLPSTQACVTSENSVAALTKAIANGPAFSCRTREKPVLCSIWSGSDAPAMKPATHASACSARTSELRKRMRPTAPRSAGALTPASSVVETSGLHGARR